MTITMLGTGTSSGVPLIGCKCSVCTSNDPKDNRLRSSIMVTINDQNLVVDTGPDFRQQMLRHEVNRMDAILFTHEHKDHVAGLDDVRAFNFINKKPVDVFASERVEGALKREFHYVFADDGYPGIPKINLRRIEPDEPFDVIGIRIIPICAMHYKLPILGFRFGDFTYLTDVNHIDESEKKKIRGSKVVVLSAIRKTPHISHYSLDEAVAVMQDLAPEKGYFTHMSHQIGKHADVNKELPAGIELAYDGLQLNM